jgi:hypothetical protein
MTKCFPTHTQGKCLHLFISQGIDTGIVVISVTGEESDWRSRSPVQLLCFGIQTLLVLSDTLEEQRGRLAPGGQSREGKPEQPPGPHREAPSGRHLGAVEQPH